jgi:hypothetical protein
LAFPPGSPLCQHHLARVVEQRVRKDLRQHGLLDPGKMLVILDDGSASSRCARSLLHRAFPTLRITTLASASALPEDVVPIIPSCLEEEVSAAFVAFLEGVPSSRPGCRPLASVSAVELAALFPKESFSQEDMLHPLLFAIERRHPGSVFALSSSLIGK